MMQDARAGRDHVGSLGRGLAVIEILARHPSGLTLTAMAEEAGLTRAGARRFLLTLTELGYATQSGRVFALSPRLLTVARTWLSGSSLWTYAEPFMREVASRLDESCSAAVLSGHDVIYVARVPGRRILSVAIHVGTRLPAFCTSMGRVLLSGLAPADLDALLKTAALTRRTARTVTDPARLAGIIGDVARQGFALVDEELEYGLRSIAVPLRNRQGAIVAALNVSTQSTRFSPEEMADVMLPHLRQAAGGIEGYFVLD